MTDDKATLEQRVTFLEEIFHALANVPAEQFHEWLHSHDKQYWNHNE
jgi:hypothetical protein